MHDVQTRTSEMGMVCAVIVCQDHIPKDVGIPCTAAPSTFDIRHTWQSEQLVEARHKRAFLNPTLPAASRSENAAKMPISESHVDRTSPREFQSSGIVYSSTAAWKRHHGGIHPTLINIKRPRHSRKEGVAQCTGDDLPRAGASSTGRLRRLRGGGGGVLQHRPLLHQHTRKRVQLPGQPPRRSAARTSPRRLARSAPCSSTLAAGSSAHHPRTSTEFRAHARALAPALAPSRPSPL
jgi:hypothetical protein